MIETVVYNVTWCVETGYCDGGGVGYWEHTIESVPFDTKEEAEQLKEQWLEEGKLEVMRWGEVRPTFSYGLFRIRENRKVLSVTHDRN